MAFAPLGVGGSFGVGTQTPLVVTKEKPKGKASCAIFLVGGGGGATAGMAHTFRVRKESVTSRGLHSGFASCGT